MEANLLAFNCLRLTCDFDAFSFGFCLLLILCVVGGVRQTITITESLANDGNLIRFSNT